MHQNFGNLLLYSLSKTQFYYDIYQVISFSFYHHYFHIQCNYYSKNYLLFLVHNNLLFFLVQKCPDITSYSIFNDFFLFNYFFLFYSIFNSFILCLVSSFVSKSLRISAIILLFNLSVIIFVLFPFTFVTIDWSNQVFMIGFIFFISCSSNLSQSFLEIIISSWNSFLSLF